MSKRVCLFGIYDSAYPHNRMLKEGLIKNGYEVIECQVNPRDFPGWLKYRELRRLVHETRREHKVFSFVIVCFPGHSVMWLARFLFPREFIIFDAFVSLYDSNVSDRKKYPKRSLRALRDWLLDWSSCRLASRVLLDTNSHIRYFTQAFDVPIKKFIRIFVGSDETKFYPLSVSVPEEPFIVHFHGTYIPLQGIPYILGAARLLRRENVKFQIIGGNQETAYVKEMRESAEDLVREGVVAFTDSVPLDKLPDAMAVVHVCLGIFGDTDKAERVIPNKVYEALAMGKPIITADTPAARELLSESVAVLIPAADASALAEAIRTLRAQGLEERRRLGAAAAELFQSRLLPKQLVRGLLDACGFL